MKMLVYFLFFSWVVSPVKASFKDYASQRQKQDMSITKSTSPNVIPGFQTASPHEVRLDNPKPLNLATQSVFGQNETAQTLKKSAETRPYFILDPQKDPLIKNSTDAIRDPEKVIRSELYNQGLHTEYTYKTCREAKPPIEFRCSKTLLPPTIHIEPAKYSHYWCGSGKHRPDDKRCQAKIYYPVARMYEPEKVKESPEAWTSDCGTMNSATQNRSCKLIRQTCPKGPETRDVVVTIGPQKQQSTRKITRPCWRYEFLYQCAYPSSNNCEGLRASTCEQIDSKCLQKRGEVCIEWEQTYKCPSRSTGLNPDDKVSNGNISLPRGKTLPKSTANKDMQEAIAKLSVLKSIQDDIRANTQSAGSIRIFKGEAGKCTIAFGGFKDCCVKRGGWGVSLNLAGCDGEDKALAEKQKRHVCVKIGTYCAEKKLGVCLRKKKSFCCFPSKLSRIIHEQGRKQLGIGWGKAKHPECRGFTIDELSRLDFDQLDLSELFDEIIAKTKTITQSTIGAINRNLSNRVSQMSQDFKPQTCNKPLKGDF